MDWARFRGGLVDGRWIKRHQRRCLVGIQLLDVEASSDYPDLSAVLADIR